MLRLYSASNFGWLVDQKRRHYKLGNISPTDYEMKLLKVPN